MRPSEKNSWFWDIRKKALKDAYKYSFPARSLGRNTEIYRNNHLEWEMEKKMEMSVRVKVATLWEMHTSVLIYKTKPKKFRPGEKFGAKWCEKGRGACIKVGRWERVKKQKLNSWMQKYFFREIQTDAERKRGKDWHWNVNRGEEGRPDGKAIHWWIPQKPLQYVWGAVPWTPAATNKRQKRKERRAATKVVLKRKSFFPVSRLYSVSEVSESRERGPPRGCLPSPDTTTQQPASV